MNWEAIGAMAELAGAVGVIATLLYLAIQIRQSSRSIESQNIHAQTQQSQQTMALQATPEVARAMNKAYVTGEDLSPEEFMLMEAYLLSKITAVRGDFLHFQKGLISREEWEQRKRMFAPYFIAKFARDHWHSTSRYFESDFRSEITELADASIDYNYVEAYANRTGDKSGS